MKLNPSPELLQTYQETDHGSPIGDRIFKLEKDFLNLIEQLPYHKSRLVNCPDSARQELIDFAFGFFIGGIDTALDGTSTFNFDRTELENRRDLN